MRRTTTTRCRWCSPGARAPGSRTSTGRRYLDLLAGYSALNFGHRHPRLVAAAEAQLGRLTLTSRAFHNDLLGHVRRGARRAVRHGHDPADEHRRRGGRDRAQDGPQVGLRGQGRARGPARRSSSWAATSTAAPRRSSASRTTRRRATASGPSRPGFVRVPVRRRRGARRRRSTTTRSRCCSSRSRARAASSSRPTATCARSGALCTERNVLMLADEIQSGLGRTGRTFACDHEGVVPDAYILGKALGGGILPVSAVVARRDVHGRLPARASTAARSAATRSPAPSASRSSGCCATGEFQARAARAGRGPARRLWTRCPATASPAFRVRGCGPASTSSAGPAATSARG